MGCWKNYQSRIIYGARTYSNFLQKATMEQQLDLVSTKQKVSTQSSTTETELSVASKHKSLAPDWQAQVAQ
jgi:hypothetical protein